MADDPYAQYLKPPGGAAPATPAVDPYAQYLKPPSAPAAPAAPAKTGEIAQPQMLPPLDPRTATTGDYLARAHQAIGGLGQIGQSADDYVRAVTGPFGDRLASVMGGGDIATQRALTAQAQARLSPEARLAATFARGAPGAAIAGPGILANAVVGGGMGYAGGLAGGDQSPGMDALLGSLFSGGGAIVGKGIGALTDKLSRLTGIGQPKPAPDVGKPFPLTPGTMEAKKAAEYAPLDQIYFDRPSFTGRLDQATNALYQVRDPFGQNVKVNIPENVQKTLMDINKEPVVTGRNLQEASRDLRDSGSPIGHRYADALDDTLANAQPMTIKGQPTGQIGEAWAAKQAGDWYSGRIKDLNRLSEEGPTGAPAPTVSAVQATKERYPPSSPEGQSLLVLQKAQQQKFNPFMFRHLAAPMVLEGAAQVDQALDPENSAPFIGSALHGLAGMALYHGLKQMSQPNPAAAAAAARYAIGTGQSLPDYGSQVGEMIRRLTMGRAAGQ